MPKELRVPDPDRDFSVQSGVINLEKPQVHKRKWSLLRCTDNLLSNGPNNCRK